MQRYQQSLIEFETPVQCLGALSTVKPILWMLPKVCELYKTAEVKRGS